MRTGNGKGKSSVRGGTAWNDGLYPIDGTGIGSGSISFAETESTGDGVAGSIGGGIASFAKTSWFTPVEGSASSDTIQIFGLEDTSVCKDGVCPVPWAVQETAPIIIRPDTVNHPAHYVEGSIECIEAIEAQLTQEECRGYLKGNIAKYIWRERHKGGTESLKKARWYLDRLIQFDEAQNG